MSATWPERPSEIERARLISASYEGPLDGSAIDAIDRWIGAQIVDGTKQVRGYGDLAIVLYARHKVAAAIASGDPSPVSQALHAGLLLSHVPASNPRAQADGADNRALFHVIEAAHALPLSIDELTQAEPAVATDLVASAQSDYQEWLDRGRYVVVSRWGAPWLTLPWDDARHEQFLQRVSPTAQPREWPPDRMPWPQSGPVLATEPTAATVQPSEVSRRHATEFARTADRESALASIEAAVTAGTGMPASLALWAARHIAGDQGVADITDLAVQRFGAALGEEPGDGRTLPEGIIVTSDGGPTFDQALPPAPKVTA